MESKAYIAYCSPNGATRIVGQTIGETLDQQSLKVKFLEITEGKNSEDSPDNGREMGAQDCLFVGSPVYRDTAIPPVMRFIESLPRTKSAYAVPFVTWGGACSGVALWQMGKALQEKGYTLAGGLSVVAVHSLMWQAKRPVCAGRPNEIDKQAVCGFTDRIASGLRAGKLSPVSLEALDYQRETDGQSMKKKLELPWLIIPKSIDEGTCTQCGLCAEECPVSAISLTPFPEFDDTCFDCYNCVRLCPEHAVLSAMSLDDIARQIRKRVSYFDEERSVRAILGD